MAGRSGKGSLSALKAPAGDYEVGYGKPPAHTRFQPGQSGNPKGRPRGSKNRHDQVGLERLKKIVLQEAYREVQVADGSRLVTVPVAEAIVRTMAVKAAKGDHRSQRLFSEMLWEIEGGEREQNRDMLMTAVFYKERCAAEIERRRQFGLPPPVFLPHPDDVVIDMVTGAVTVTGPVIREQLDLLHSAWGHKADFEYLIDELEKEQAGARSAKRQQVLRDAISYAQERLQFFTGLLPDESYERWSRRYPADGELVEISVPRVKPDGFR